MADSPGQRLAGIFGPRFRDAMAVPQEDMSVKLARALGAFGQNPQSVTTRAMPPALPAFVPPGSAMTEAIGPGVPFTPPRANVPVQTMPTTTVQASPLPSPTAATQPQLEQPAATPPMPEPVTVRDDVLKAAQQMLAQNLLPEQWKGAFTNAQGFPR